MRKQTISPRELDALADKLIDTVGPFHKRLAEMGTGISFLDAERLREEMKREVVALLCSAFDPPTEG